jgi:hypothetical protein
LGCKSGQSTTEVIPADSFAFELLDSTEAAKSIILDEKDDFFLNVTKVDMAIQMKSPLMGYENRRELLESYKAYLQTDVVDFTDQEKQNLNKVMIKAMNLCNSLSPNIVPQPVKLIKTKGKHYGDGAFYTRERCIIIPESDLRNFDEDSFLAVLLHELSHIITRYDPELKDKFYKQIGFEKIVFNNSDIILPEFLGNNLLNNPDGLSMQHAIRLVKPNGKLIWALPLIHSNYENYTSDVPYFFGYLKFELFELEEKANGQFEVISKKDGNSTLNLQELPGFFDKIGNNTQYIIHPDEIIAENFYMMILATSNTAGFDMDDFSEEGRVLIEKIREVVVGRL